MKFRKFSDFLKITLKSYIFWNSDFRDLKDENNEYRQVVNERLLPYVFSEGQSSKQLIFLFLQNSKYVPNFPKS